MSVLGVKCKRFKGATPGWDVSQQLGMLRVLSHAPADMGGNSPLKGAVLHVPFSFVFSPFLTAPKPVTFHKPGVPHAALISTF